MAQKWTHRGSIDGRRGSMGVPDLVRTGSGRESANGEAL